MPRGKEVGVSSFWLFLSCALFHILLPVTPHTCEDTFFFILGGGGGLSEGTYHSHVTSGDMLPSLGQNLGFYTWTSRKGVYDPPLGHTVWGERIA